MSRKVRSNPLPAKNAVQVKPHSSNGQSAGPLTAQPHVTDPLKCLVLWGMVIHHEDAPALLTATGIEKDELDKFASGNKAAVEEMRTMGIAAALLDRKAFARLVRVRVGVKLMETEDPRQLAALVSAAIKLPAWIFDESAPISATVKGIANGGAAQANTPCCCDDLMDITGMGMQETIAEAKKLITELEKPGGLHVP